MAAYSWFDLPVGERDAVAAAIAAGVMAGGGGGGGGAADTWYLTVVVGDGGDVVIDSANGLKQYLLLVGVPDSITVAGAQDDTDWNTLFAGISESGTFTTTLSAREMTLLIQVNTTLPDEGLTLLGAGSRFGIPYNGAVNVLRNDPLSSQAPISLRLHEFFGAWQIERFGQAPGGSDEAEAFNGGLYVKTADGIVLAEIATDPEVQWQLDNPI